MKLVSRKEWGSLREERGISLFVFLRTEVLERLLFFKQIFKNNEQDSDEGLREMNKQLDANTYNFTDVKVDYEAFPSNIQYLKKGIS